MDSQIVTLEGNNTHNLSQHPHTIHGKTKKSHGSDSDVSKAF